MYVSVLPTYCDRNLLNLYTDLYFLEKLVASYFLLLLLFINGVYAIMRCQKYKYYSWICPRKEFTILNLSPIYSNLYKQYLKYQFVNIKRSSMYAWIYYTLWNKLFIFCWNISGELAT